MAPRDFSEDGATAAGSPSATVSPPNQFSRPSFPMASSAPAMGGARRPMGVMMPGAALSFAAGGAIDTGEDDTSDVTDPGAALQKALGTVKAVLAYGRQRHGLGGGADAGAISDPSMQMAGRMPTVPGTQSESGVRQQPAPGPLPMPANPFGKRTASADQDNDGDSDAPGAIDTDEETA